jgi:hypothetical protein
MKSPKSWRSAFSVFGAESPVLNLPSSDKSSLAEWRHRSGHGAPPFRLAGSAPASGRANGIA